MIKTINTINMYLGSFSMWCSAFMVFTQCVIILLRYVFNINFIWMQESLLYAFSAMFLLSSAWAYRQDQHVRIDVISDKFSERGQKAIDGAGILLILFPMCFVIVAFSWRYVLQSWAVLERSNERSGLPFIYILKTLIIVFALQLLLQGFVKLHEILFKKRDM